MNNIHRYLEFKLTTAENNNISYLDLSIHRDNHGLRMGIYRKPTQTGITIHFTSNHPLEHKQAAYNFYINRMLSMPITNQARQQEWDTICTIARNNGFPLRTIHNLRKRINKTQKTDSNSTDTPKKIWVTLTYHSPHVHKVTNLFKHIIINAAFRTSNTIHNWLQDKIPQNKINSSGIYKLQCKACNTYIIRRNVGHTGRTLTIRHREHTRYIRTNNPASAYALHILNNRHEYGNPQHTIQLLRTYDGGKLMKGWESFYMQKLQQLDLLIDENKHKNPTPYTHSAT
jgi:hypothetical protein